MACIFDSSVQELHRLFLLAILGKCNRDPLKGTDFIIVEPRFDHIGDVPDSINIAVLIWLTYRQFRDGRPRWVPSLHAVYSHGAVAYLAWALFLTLAIPFLFPG